MLAWPRISCSIFGRVARLDHQRRGGVPQIVNPETVTERGAVTGRYEGGTPSVGQSHDSAAGMVNTRSSGRLPSMAAVRSMMMNRDGPRLVRLWDAEDDMPTDIGEGAADIDAAAVQIDVADPQGGGLAPAQAGVGQEQDKQTPGARLAGQREDLGVSEVDVIASLRRGSPRPRAGFDRMRPLRTA